MLDFPNFVRGIAAIYQHEVQSLVSKSAFLIQVEHLKQELHFLLKVSIRKQN